jgi:hypothetical protein
VINSPGVRALLHQNSRAATPPVWHGFLSEWQTSGHTNVTCDAGGAIEGTDGDDAPAVAVRRAKPYPFGEGRVWRPGDGSVT